MPDFIALDSETYDPDLKELGSGNFRDDTYLLGVSWADSNGHAEYLNLGHPGVTSEEKNKNLAKVQKILLDPRPKVFANCMYDLGFFRDKYGMEVKGEIYDIQHTESLLDEYRSSYSLDSLAESYLGLHKEKGEIEAFCERNGWKGDPRAHLYKMPYSIVEKYAKADVTLPLAIIEKQLVKIQGENLTDLYDMERTLFWPFLDMRKNGLKVDESRRQKAMEIHEKDLRTRQRAWDKAFPGVSINSSKQLATLFENEGIPFEVSPAGKQALLARLGRPADAKRAKSVAAEELFDELGMDEEARSRYRLEYPSIDSFVLDVAGETYPLAKEVKTIRKLDKLIGTFLDNYLVKYVTKGYIHPTFHIFASDEGGTVTGRASCSKPNSENFPKAKKDFNPMVRDCIVPEEGYWFGKIDYMAQESRIISHYGIGPTAEVMRKAYIDDPHLDMHQMIADMAHLSRSVAKTVEFGLCYGLGVKSMAHKQMWSLDYATEVFRQFNEMVPFILDTRTKVGQVARQRGYIKSILNRRCRFTDEMKKRNKDYLFLNRLIQSSAADQTKKAISLCYTSGLFNTLIPINDLHDEVDVLVPKTKEGIDAFREMQHIMETAILLKVPVIAEPEISDSSWGETHEFNWEDLYKELQ